MEGGGIVLDLWTCLVMGFAGGILGGVVYEVIGRWRAMQMARRLLAELDEEEKRDH